MSRARTWVALAAPLVAYCAFVFVVSALQAPPAPDYPFAWGDKLTHALVYAAMLPLAVRAMRLFPARASLRSRLLPAFLFCALYGATDEIHQYFVPGRSCDVFDWIADAVGAGASAWILPALARLRFVARLAGEPAAEA